MQRRVFIGAVAAAVCAPALADEDSEALWRRLQKGGYVVLMRHAVTVPGIGDPPGFKLADCSTQRNLSEEGRRDARQIGAAFRGKSIPIASVLSSRWCRCIDTAKLAFDRVEPAPMLDSMFIDDAAARRSKLAALRTRLAAFRNGGNLVLVTNDVNIRALIDRYVNQGDMVVATIEAGGALKALGVLKPADLRKLASRASSVAADSGPICTSTSLPAWS